MVLTFTTTNCVDITKTKYLEDNNGTLPYDYEKLTNIMIYR